MLCFDWSFVTFVYNVYIHYFMVVPKRVPYYFGREIHLLLECFCCGNRKSWLFSFKSTIGTL